MTLLMNLERRRGNSRSAAIIDLINRNSGKISGRLIVSIAALLSEDQLKVEELLLAAANSPNLRARELKILADIALTAGRQDLAERFVESMPGSSVGYRVTRAKLFWHKGEMTRAISELTSNHPRERRLRDIYQAEKEVFGGWKPTLPSIELRTPRPNVVLHLLTNSLPHTESGYTQRTHSILLEQARAGLEVHAVTRLGYPQSLNANWTQKIDLIDGIKYHRMILPGQRGNLRDHHQLESEHLLELVKRIRPSVIHTTTHFVNGLVAGEVARSAGIPWIYEIRGQLSDTWASKRAPEATQSERYLQFKRMEMSVANSADGVITIGNSMRSRLIDRGMNPSKISVAPNAVGERYICEPVNSNLAKASLGLDPYCVYIGTVSSLVSYEGLDVLLEAFDRLRNSNTNVRLLIVGDGDAAHALKRKARSLNLDPEEIFPGRVSRSEAVKFHQALDIFVVPRVDQIVTRSVTPLKPVEAMAMSRPVVASDLPALGEIIRDGDNGILVPPGDASALADALLLLAEDEALRHRLGSNGRKMILMERTWSKSVRASLDWYEKLSRYSKSLDEEDLKRHDF